MNKKQTLALQNRLVYALHMVDAGCPLKDFLDHSEIGYILQLYATSLIAQGIVQPYEYDED